MTSSELVRMLSDLGCNAEAIAVALEAIEAARVAAREASEIKKSSARQARWREKKRLQASTEASTERLHVDGSTEGPPPSPEKERSPPTTPSKEKLTLSSTPEKKLEQKKSVDEAVEVFLRGWDWFAGEYGKPRVRRVGPSLRAAIAARMADLSEVWPADSPQKRVHRFLKLVEANDWWMGRGENSWGGLNIAWVTGPKNFEKIINSNPAAPKPEAFRV